jgi:hypothetical protein
MEHIFVAERSHLPWVSKKLWKILTWSIGHGRKIMIEDSLTMKNSPFTTIFIVVDGHFSSSVRMATTMNSALATSMRRMRSWRCGLTYSHCQTKRMQHCCLFQDGVPVAERHPQALEEANMSLFARSWISPPSRLRCRRTPVSSWRRIDNGS